MHKETFKPYAKWFKFMTQPYRDIASNLVQEFPAVNIFVCHDMDMEHWYELSPPKYLYAEQVERMSALARERDGKLLPFYGYDPVRGIDHLREAIAEKGYVGVKFYPPSGYKPYTDQWQATNKFLYKYCQDNRVPLFTHCNDHGMEAYPGAGRNSDPHYWELVLNDHPDLVLCFGHAGGEKGWFTPEVSGDGNHYVRKVYDLCTRFEHVYCDMGYFPGVYKPNGLDILRNNLLALFERSATMPFQFDKKIMYGSDWHMIMQEDGAINYFPKFDQLFSASEYPG
ncbi:MAG: hypothetical protein EOP49_37770, partial [Sphingobacteriales bacterium]